nr:MAG TPA: hypothetical protein [Caudoviricetes sp.]
MRLGCAPPCGPSCASGSRGCPLRRFQGRPGRVAWVGGRNRLRIDPRASEGVPLNRPVLCGVRLGTVRSADRRSNFPYL